MNAKLRELELAVEKARQEDQLKLDQYRSARQETMLAIRELLIARAESVGIRVGSPVTVVHYQNVVNGVVVELDVHHDNGYLVIAPLTKSGKPHNTRRHESCWQDESQSFSDELRKRED